MEAGADEVRSAVAELRRLVGDGGVVAAGAGVELGGGFRSARLDGARGDQRDAVLAALRVLGLEGAGRLGERGGFLVALFGPSVTRRVGAAAARAIGEGRWAALHLASAASDVLGPEQLERVLALEAPDGGVMIPGGQPSALATRLRQVLEPVARPRRLELILDLWERVLEHHAGLAVRERRLATQGRRDRFCDIVARRRHHEDEALVRRLRAAYGGEEPTLADAARWTPPYGHWYGLLQDLVEDALAATALLRTAAAVADHGFEDGLTRSTELLRVAVRDLSAVGLQEAKRRVPGMTGLPPRPVVYVHDIVRALESGTPKAKLAGLVRQRLAIARDYALVVIRTAEHLLDAPQVPEGVLRDWAVYRLPYWRKEAGYTRPPEEWGGIPPWSNGAEPLAQRIADLPRTPVAEVENVGDLLWYVDLVDALARLYGHDLARPMPGTGAPWFDHDPPPPDTGPLTPKLDSVTLAVSGAAQLVALGGVPPKGAKTWTSFTEGLQAGTAIAAALTGGFAVPAPIAALDGTLVEGTRLRVRVARDARTLAEWSEYMGNCIAGPYYLDDARAGRCGLAGLYDEGGFLIANADLRPLRPATRGWRLDEIAVRFNETPAPELDAAVRAWAATIPGVAPAVTEVVADEPPPDAPARPRPRPRLVEDAGPAIGALARQAWDAVAPEVVETFAVVAGTPQDAALTHLRRLGPEAVPGLCRDALESGAVGFQRLWTASGTRPMRDALDALDPELRERFDQLPLLLTEPPLPKTLRKLVKAPAIADAFGLDLAARRVRAALGRLAREDHPAIARALARGTTEPMLCALTVMINCRAPGIPLMPVAGRRIVTVPGYPVTSLKDENGPWQRAFPDARELGADTEAFWPAIAAAGLRVPVSWLSAGGWPALWSRAHSRRS
ncbi:hypothetical protein [Spirillospora sp. CA-294931]|uniref:hypothetical protein n=1 Tax=Spirillospora sp. CA-294931 TaxID=3240042 RepID=UPI003D8C9D6F